MTNFKLIIHIVIACLFPVYSWGYTYPEAKITGIVVDEAGLPMEGVDIVIGFDMTGKVKGITDSKGAFSASKGVAKTVALTVTKDGYYQNYTEYHFQDIKNDRWLHWNPEVTLVMRKIENPVAMWARDTKKSGLKIPVVGKNLGFDLMEYDWVEPYGKGKQADFIFKVDRRYVNNDDFDCTMTLTFPNKFDGIQLVKEDRR